MVEYLEALLLSENVVTELLSMNEVIEVVEESFKEFALKTVQMPPKIYLKYRKHNGDLRTMPAFLEKMEISAVKVVNVHPNNVKKYNLPTVMATILLIEPKNGKLLAVIAGRNITSYRTGAAGAVAAKYLAKNFSEKISFIGAGVQARTQLEALFLIYPNISQIKIWDISVNASKYFKKDIEQFCPNNKNLQISITPNVQEAVQNSDIVVTTTPSSNPLVFKKWVSKGTHFNCIGADAPKKQELDIELLFGSKVVVDDWVQAAHSGEINIPFSKGLLNKKNVWAELGEIVAKIKSGRSSNDEITIFDSTGLAIQDAVTAKLIYQKALKKKVGLTIEI